MARLIEIKQKIPALYLTWIINNTCTNQCSYCPSDLHSGTNYHYEWEHALELSEVLFSKYDKIHLAISGGEPTLSPWLKDLVKMYSDRGHPVGMTTNGARTIRYYEDIAPYMSYIVLSYHPSFDDPLLLEKAKACVKTTPTCISVMMDSRHLDKALGMYNRIIEDGTVNVEPVRITDWGVGNSLGRDYTSEQERAMSNLSVVHDFKQPKPRNESLTGAIGTYDNGIKMRINAADMIYNNETNFQGWECDIGLESLHIRYDGRIRTANCNSSDWIGKITDVPGIQWPTRSKICPQNFCHCTTDVYVSKRRTQ